MAVRLEQPRPQGAFEGASSDARKRELMHRLARNVPSLLPSHFLAEKLTFNLSNTLSHLIYSVEL